MKVTVRDSSSGIVRVALSGTLDEHAAAALLEVNDSPTGAALEFDLDGIEHVNSMGLSAWLSFIDGLPPGVSYSFVRAPRVMVDAANILSRLFGRGPVRSFYAPYRCDKCRREREVLLDIAVLGHPQALPNRPCPACKAECKAVMPREDFDNLLATPA